MTSLIHLIYASTATHDFNDEQLTQLLQQSRAANESHHLTGMLLYSARNFFQVLEGAPEDVDRLYEKLPKDDRHFKMTLIIREPIQKRCFADWSMGFSSMSADELANMEGLNDFFQDGSCFADLDAGRAKKLLAAFAMGRWRTQLTGQGTIRT